MPNCATPWRRRRKHRMSAAQLSLPFIDGDQPVLAESAVLAGFA
jgi:hypothetical protein